MSRNAGMTRTLSRYFVDDTQAAGDNIIQTVDGIRAKLPGTARRDPRHIDLQIAGIVRRRFARRCKR